MSIVARRLRSLVQVAASGFTPSSIANLALWLDSSDAATFTFGTGSAVSQWNDKSGNARHFTQATAGNRPTRSGTQNSLDTVAFASASSQFMTAGDALDMGTSDLSVFAVAKLGSAASQGIITKSLFASGAGRWGLYKDSSAMNGIYTNSGSTLRIASPAFSATTWQQFGLQVNRSAGALNVRIAAAQAATTSFTAESVSLNSAYHLLLGAYGDNPGTGGTQSGYFLNGEIAEVCVYLGHVTGTNLSDLESYFATKWSV